jgi:hypothetical protein
MIDSAVHVTLSAASGVAAEVDVVCCAIEGGACSPAVPCVQPANKSAVAAMPASRIAPDARE